MKKIFFTLVFVPLLLEARSISELFDALKSHAQVKSDTILVKKSALQKDLAEASLYPKINLFVSYDNYSSPANMKPIAPNAIKPMLAPNSSIPQPYSYNIYRAGAAFSMPLFVKSIYTTAKKAEAMQRSAQAKKHIDILKNEAVIVGANANFAYLVSLQKALQGKEKSLQAMQTTVEIQVKNGRLPASALYKINDSMHEVAIQKNNIELQKKKLISTIESLTGIRLKEPIPMREIATFTKGDFNSLRAVQEKIRAQRINVKSQKERLYPALYAHGSYIFSKANAYNNDRDVNEEYGDIGITLNNPLVEMHQYSALKLAKVELQSSEVELEKLREELLAQSEMLEASLPLLENSRKLYEESIKNKQKLLDIAKVSYASGRISTEEYLRYEDAVVAQKANLYKTEATTWQTLMQLAVIYGNSIEEMVQ